MFRVSVQSQRSEHRRSESAFRVEVFRAIIFQRRSEPLFFRVSIQSIDVQSRGVQSHYFSKAFRAIIFQSQHSEHIRLESAFRAYD